MNPFKTSLSLSDTLAILKTYLDCWLSLLYTKAWEVEADQCIWLIQEIHEVLELIAPWGFIFLISSLRFVQYALNIFTPTSFSPRSIHHLITFPSLPILPFRTHSTLSLFQKLGPIFVLICSDVWLFTGMRMTYEGLYSYHKPNLSLPKTINCQHFIDFEKNTVCTSLFLIWIWSFFTYHLSFACCHIGYEFIYG